MVDQHNSFTNLEDITKAIVEARQDVLSGYSE